MQKKTQLIITLIPTIAIIVAIIVLQCNPNSASGNSSILPNATSSPIPEGTVTPQNDGNLIVTAVRVLEPGRAEWITLQWQGPDYEKVTVKIGEEQYRVTNNDPICVLIQKETAVFVGTQQFPALTPTIGEGMIPLTLTPSTTLPH